MFGFMDMYFYADAFREEYWDPKHRRFVKNPRKPPSRLRLSRIDEIFGNPRARKLSLIEGVIPLMADNAKEYYLLNILKRLLHSPLSLLMKHMTLDLLRSTKHLPREYFASGLIYSRGFGNLNALGDEFYYIDVNSLYPRIVSSFEIPLGVKECSLREAEFLVIKPFPPRTFAKRFQNPLVVLPSEYEMWKHYGRVEILKGYCFTAWRESKNTRIMSSLAALAKEKALKELHADKFLKYVGNAIRGALATRFSTAGAYITSIARSLLLEAIEDYNAIYADTDSIITRERPRLVGKFFGFEKAKRISDIKPNVIFRWRLYVLESIDEAAFGYALLKRQAKKKADFVARLLEKPVKLMAFGKVILAKPKLLTKAKMLTKKRFTLEA